MTRQAEGGALPWSALASSLLAPPRLSPPLRVRGRDVGVRGGAVMAIVNRTTDSFFPGARHADDDVALAAVERAVRDGAEIIDVGGVRAGVGPDVSPVEEIDRVAPFIARLRSEVGDDVVLSVDTWRADVAEAVAQAGAELLNDTWAGADPGLVEVAGRRGLAVVVSHTGGLPPRTDPHGVRFDLPPDAPDDADPLDAVVHDVVATLRRGAARAVACGVDPLGVLVDPTHDFGKRTVDSLRLVRHTPALVSLGHPVLMALSRKDFVGETLDLPVNERLEGTLAATALAAWGGARVFRAHDVRATRRTLDMVAAIRGDLPPRAAVRGL
ncbi:dihydropteroate synthase [Sanguibacter sp. A247]|uniref:dihydropteroate synthase n=1 Tax=unclassified Sanguibacter TaxID=2645534 RepID=UPI003FD8751D